MRLQRLKNLIEKYDAYNMSYKEFLEVLIYAGEIN